MKYKRGQFYLFAAIIILIVAVGFIITSNYAVRTTNVKLDSIKEELGIEGANVLDYGVYNQYNQEEMKILLTNFTKTYTDYAGIGRNFYFIFGTRSRITVVTYQDLTKEDAFINVGGELDYRLTEGSGGQDFTPIGDLITIKINNENHEFVLKEGENFYFIITQTTGGERHIITGSAIFK